jgi:serine protease inhibitor
MKTPHIMFLGLLALTVFSCKKDEPVKPEMKQIVLTPAQKSMVNAGNEFAFQLLHKVNLQEGAKDQFFISPYSAAEALSMTLNGARGCTSDSMKMVLGYTGMDSATINGYCKTLRTTLLSLDPKVQLSIANSIWYRQGFEVLPAFVKVNQDYFDAAVRGLNFSDPAASDIINNWIEDKTNGRIQDMISEIDPATVMFLINALWFKAQWQSQFDANLTRLDNFTPDGGSTLQVPMMQQTQAFGYFENDLIQMAELPYGQGNFAMNILLPAEGKTVDDIMSVLEPVKWKEWMESLQQRNLFVYFPRLKFTCELNMNDVLKSLGMSNAFCDLADFTGIRASGGLMISQVRQNTFLEVNEKGAEAAAVTVVEIIETTAGPGPVVTDFIADRPFLFIITERSTGAILFAGRINKPAF